MADNCMYSISLHATSDDECICTTSDVSSTAQNDSSYHHDDHITVKTSAATQCCDHITTLVSSDCHHFHCCTVNSVSTSLTPSSSIVGNSVSIVSDSIVSIGSLQSSFAMLSEEGHSIERSLPNNNGLNSDSGSPLSTSSGISQCSQASTPPISTDSLSGSNQVSVESERCKSPIALEVTTTAVDTPAFYPSGAECHEDAMSLFPIHSNQLFQETSGLKQQYTASSTICSSSQHVVHVHVNPGETFSVRLGDQIQHIQGPATVRMVSANGPPLPMPMQVPPGHMVQQIVDEHGILTHVILSPQPPIPAGPPVMASAPSNAQHYFPSHFPPYPTPTQYPPPHHTLLHPGTHNVHAHMHARMPNMHSPSPQSCTNHSGPIHSAGIVDFEGNSPPLNSSDDRTLRQRNRVRKKVQQRRPDGVYSYPCRHLGRNVNGEMDHGNGHRRNIHCENGSVDPEEDQSLIIQCLSGIPSPKVSDIETRSAVIQLSPPECNGPPISLEIQDCQYELLLSDKGCDAKYKMVFCGDATEITLKDLKPAVEYHLNSWSEAVTFYTSGSVPGQPDTPVLTDQLSSSLTLSWHQRLDEDEFTLQMDDEVTGHGFIPVFNGSNLSYTVRHLRRNSAYSFRLCSKNDEGHGKWSDVAVFRTLPDRPCPPSKPQIKGRVHSHSFAITWEPPKDDGGAEINRYVVELDDGQGYPQYDGGSQVVHFTAQVISADNSVREVYKGPDLDCIVAGLLPGRCYLFQVRAVNRAGAGPWSELLEVVSGVAIPDPPHCPQLMCQSPQCILITWEEPFNNGSEVSDYRLELDRSHDGQEYMPVYVGPKLSCDVNGLTPATTYSFRVQAANEAGTSPYSPVASCETPASSPGTVASLQWQAYPKSVKLWWRPPPCNGSDLVSYNICVVDRQLITIEPVAEYLLDSLQPETAYKVRVQAENGVGVGSFSVSTRVTTSALPPSPPHLVCLSASANNLKLKWGDGRNVELMQYTLEIEKDTVFQTVYSGQAHTYKVNRLTEMTSYEFRISASNDAGQGPHSDDFVFSTVKATPSALKAPTVHDVSYRLCHVDWPRCRLQCSDPISYVLQVLSPRPPVHSCKPVCFPCMPSGCGKVSIPWYTLLHDGRPGSGTVYRGHSCHCLLDSLEPDTEYMVKVCAVRQCDDGHPADLQGPFSPCAHFHTLASEPSRPATHADMADSVGSSLLAGPQQWSDQRWAAVILFCFVLLAGLVAFLTQQALSRMSGSPAGTNAAESASYTPSGQGHVN